MLDITQYSYGFGVVLLPFLVGFAIRVVISTLKAGSMRKYAFVFILPLILSSSASDAGEYTGTLLAFADNGTSIHVTDGSLQLFTSDESQADILKEAFYNNRELIITYSDLDYSIENIAVADNETVEANAYSLFIGALAGISFVLAVTMRI